MIISFTSIRDLYTATKKQNQVGSYLTHDGDVKTGKKEVTYVNISYSVTDDKSGRDHDRYIEALSKARKFDYINSHYPSTVDFEVKIDKIKTPYNTSRNVSFKLNNKPIAFNTDKDIPIFQYLADMTRERLKEKSDVSNYDKQCLDMANDAITEAAINYFDLV